MAGAVTGAFKVNTIWVLVAAGVIGLVAGRKRLVEGSEHNRSNANREEFTPPKTGNMALIVHPAVGANDIPVSFTTVGLAFLKIGLVFFGGGLVLITVLHQ